MTYRELNQRANALASHLQTMGVRRDVFVGYFGKRTLDWVVAILAIWKAGGIYVPLDPAYPSERIGYMMADSGMKVLLTDSDLLEKLPAHQAAVVLLDQAVEAEGVPDIVGDAGPDDIAYVIYTSGSTGRPKGAMVEHKGMINHLCAKVEELGMSELDQVAQNSSHCVDISIWQLFSVLLVGGCVHLLPDEIAFDTSRQVEAIEGLCLTIVETVPTLLRAMLDEIAHLSDKPSFAALRWMIPNGEALPPELCRRWLTAYPNVPLINAYGPTECSDDVTHEYIREVPSEDVLSMRIGKALPNVRLYVLDPHRSIVPIGVMGELYVGGIVVGRGYLNNPEKTEAAYSADWITEQPGARLYRTGDYVRYLEDGSLEFMGRVDHQVKIRGLRIELGDIEAALTQHPEVEHAIVVTKGEEHEKRLMAYMISARGANPTNRELHAFLADTLPAHMIPNAFVQLEEFPLTLNGKIDRKRLPDVIVEPEAGEHYVEPTTPEERLMTSLWSEMLGVVKVGLADNFFDIGGHSLTAIHLIARVRREFSVDVSLRTLFEAPTPAELLAALRLAKEVAATPEDNRMVHVSRDQELAASFAQQRLWLIHQLEPNSSSYNLTFRFDLHGPLDRQLLQNALQAVVDRQEVFRTVFEEREGQPVPVLLPKLLLDWQEEDLTVLADYEEKARRVGEIIQQQSARVYDLRQAPLFGTRLVRLAAEHHVLVLNMHHIVFDGWSVEVLINEWIAHYTAAPLPQLDVQYVDYAAWQRVNLTGEAYDQQLLYWQNKLGGELPMLQLPSDQTRQPNRESVGNVKATLLPKRLINRLQELSQESGATMFMIMLAAYKTLLYRYTGQTDLLVGVPAANRNREELQGLIGFFVNMLAMRTDLSGDLSFADLVDRVKEVAMEAYANQDVPFDTLVEMLQPEREEGRTPIIQTVFSYETYKPEQRAFADTGLTMRVEEIRNQTSKFDLSFYMQEQEEGIKLEIEYDAVLFDATMIERMLENFSVLLEGIVRDPSQSIETLPLLAEREKQRLLQWTETATPYPSEQSIPHLFEAQAARTPDAIAATFGEEQVTYRMLDERANRYARLLCEHGVTLEQPVGIAVDRSIEMLVGILAILKAGGAYVPLDTKYPADRLKFMMENAGIRVILAQRQKEAELPAHDATVIVLDEAMEDGEEFGEPGLALPCQPRQMACVLYTSGSTGQPKGVRVTHQGILRLVLGTDYMTFENETFLQFSPLSFDASTFEIWGSLLHGNRLVIMPPHMASLEELGEVVRREGVTSMWLTAGLFHQLADIPLDAFASVRHLLAGGEALLPAPTHRIQQKLPGCRIIHIYGPTENSSFSTHYQIPWTEEVPSYLPIGRAVANSTTYVLDGQQQLVPIGVQGELYVGGDGVALGYLNRPDLTEASFIPDPFSDKPGARLYRTGDLARYNSVGELICLGRADRQLKIRGFRIELGEVDAICRQHPSVRHTLTIAHEDKNGSKRIVVYVVPNDPIYGLDHSLDQHMRTHLPYFMIPSAYMTVDELPLNANGKVDQRRLPQPVYLQTSDHHVAPRTELEQNVAAAWEEVLDQKYIGVHDDFFDLGGHSLLATRMISRLRSRLGVEVPLRVLFAAPTLEGFTEHVARCMQDVPSPQVPSIRPLELGERKPLSFAQRRLWFLNEWMPESSLYNVPFFYWLNGRLDVEALAESLQEIV
ncbi:MAG: amino acid adenylation domain-containing protein, partial [Tumebacillaceae bacterium]